MPNFQAVSRTRNSFDLLSIACHLTILVLTIFLPQKSHLFQFGFLFFFYFFFTHERYTVESHEPSIFSKFLSFLPPVSIGNSMICSDIWHKYHEWYFEIVIRNFETIFKYHEWYLCQISLQIMLLFVCTTTRKRFVIFTCRYFH